MKLYYRKTGEGKPLIILHGLFGMSDNWMTLAKQFAEHGFACYTVDQRNHGRSPHNDEFNYKVMAEDISQLMEDEHITSACFIGHSMGGKTAMFFAAAYPEKVEHLIVADMAPKYYPANFDRELLALKSIDLNNIGTRKEAEEQLRRSLHDEATLQFLLKNLYWKEGIGDEGRGGKGHEPEKKLAWRFNLSSIEKNMDAVGESLPVDARFNKPVLFLRGEKSGYVTEDDIPDIKKHFPQAQMITIPFAGHWIHAENPKAFMEIVLKFLNG